MHRFVLSEFNTHRQFSRNSASSRAIPVEKQLTRVKDDAAWPVLYPTEKPGMQGGVELEGDDLDDAKDLFRLVHHSTVEIIDSYLEFHPDKSQRLHKSLVNRLLEPFMWHTVIVSSTDWSNFFGLRCNELAQPEIRAAAEAMQNALRASKPTVVKDGEWHTPYVQADEYSLDLEVRKKISAARCARVSYLTHDGARDIEKDLMLFKRLTTEKPPHASPLEHVATPTLHWSVKCKGNFTGWHQMRHLEA